MIIGSVRPGGEAVVSLRIKATRGDPMELQAVVDTGFNDSLTLPSELIEKLGLARRGGARCVLADGSEIKSRVFTAQLEWLGAWRRILVLEVEGGPLLGMALLRGHFLGIEVTDGGAVEVRALKS